MSDRKFDAIVTHSIGGYEIGQRVTGREAEVLLFNHAARVVRVDAAPEVETEDEPQDEAEAAPAAAEQATPKPGKSNAKAG